MTLFIADVSNYNANYVDIANKNDGVIVKISEGLSYINPLANAQYEAAKNAGKKIGVYHFIVGGLDARKQAEYFYNNATNYINAKNVIPILDWEKPSNYPALTGDEPKAFMDRIYELSGKRGLVYMSTSDFISAKYNWSDIKKDYGLWIAGYPKNDGSNYSSDLQNWADNSQMYFANAKYDGYTVAMWQYDSVPYDRSVFYGDGNAWNKYGSKSNASTVMPKPEPAKPSTPAKVQNVTAMQQFKNAGGKFVSTKSFRVDAIAYVNGMWQIINYDLAGGKDANWTNNGIPLAILSNVTRGNNSPTQVGDMMKFDSGYDSGTIDKYDNNSNGVGVVMGRFGLIWFSADGFNNI